MAHGRRGEEGRSRDGEPLRPLPRREAGEPRRFPPGLAQKGHTYDDDYRGAESQYWLTLEDGVVVAIDEQYVP
jgi:hypothetical protein